MPGSLSAARTCSSMSPGECASTSRAPIWQWHLRSRRQRRGSPHTMGLLRSATQAERRLEECAKFGLKSVVVPAETPANVRQLQVLEAETLPKAIAAGLDSKTG